MKNRCVHELLAGSHPCPGHYDKRGNRMQTWQPSTGDCGHFLPRPLCPSCLGLPVLRPAEAVELMEVAA